MRKVDVDLSDERMKVAWKAYRERWKREEDRLKKLEELKVVSFYKHIVVWRFMAILLHIGVSHGFRRQTCSLRHNVTGRAKLCEGKHEAVQAS